MTLADDPQHRLLGLFQVVEEDSFALAATVGIGGHRLQVLQRQGQMALEQFLPEGRWPAEEAVRQALDLTHAQLLAAEGADELVQVGGGDAL